LDVGCGNRPFALATHLADASLNDNSHRFGLPIPADGRPVVECSVESMPFENKEFDFVFCSHVLEHVEDPVRACRELMRVGRRGYIECPRSWTEYVFSSREHRWLVDAERGVLIFREKLTNECGDPLGVRDELLPRLARDPLFARHWNSRRMLRLRNVEFKWEDCFAFLVLRAEDREPSRPGASFERPPRAPYVPFELEVATRQ